MDIDIYQQCPCHSGNKIKFCCGKDIVSELNQIVAKCNANQSLSALDQIDRVIAKHGEKDCLLSLRTHILFTLGETEKADEANQKFAANNPNHPMVRQHEALSALSNGNVVQAIDKLQDAMDLITNDEIPLPFSNAFKLVGGILLQAGHVIAARAHLQFALMIRGEKDEEISELIRESFRLPGAPMILKTDFRLDPIDQDKEWADKYEKVVRAMNRGQFRLALKMLTRMDEHWPDQPQLVRGIAVVHSMLANEEEMASAWHCFALMNGVPNWQAVEAEAISQIFMTEDPSGELDVVAIQYSIASFENVLESINSSGRFVVAPTPEEDPFESGPAPRNCFYVLDRDKIESVEDVSPFDIPIVSGEVLLYGKQTDREARAAFFLTKNEKFEEVYSHLVELLGEQVSGEPEQQVVTSSSVATDLLTWNWQIPKGTRAERHRELMSEYRKHVLVNQWPEIKFKCLNGNSVAEAKNKPEFAVTIAAMVANLEQSVAIQLSGGDEIAALRESLGIEFKQDLNAAEHSEENWTAHRLRQFAPDTFSDEQLLRIYVDSVSIGNTFVLKRIIPEILNRDSVTQVPKDICYSMLAQLTDDDTKAVEYLQQARQHAKSEGRSIGQLLVQEFETRLTRGMTDKLPELLQTIQRHHMKEANVEYQLVRVLSKFGLISPDGRTVSLPASSQPSEPESKIWTPDADESTVSSGASGESKIWVPGSD